MDTIPSILLNMLEHESSQARFVLASVKDVDMQFTPMDSLRTLDDLANHLALSPLIDFYCYTKKFQEVEQIQEMEKQLKSDNIEGMLKVFDKGIGIIKEHISALSNNQALEENLKAVYEQGPDRNWTHYLPEITTHLAMHKMQLWMYLRLAGAPVSMWTYYGVPRNE